MEIAWLTPLVMVLLPQVWRAPAWLSLAIMWAVMAGMMLIARFLETRDIPSPGFEILVGALLVLLGWIAVRMVVFPQEPFFSLGWVGQLFTWSETTLQAGVVLATLAFLWWRAVTLLQREISFFLIGYDFRRGVLGLLLSITLFRHVTGESAMWFVLVFFFFGLMAVALGRAEDISRTTGEGRAAIPRTWLGVATLNTLTVMGLAWAFGQVWSLRGFQSLWAWMRPAFVWVEPYVTMVILAFLRLLEPLILWLIAIITSILSNGNVQETFDNLTRRFPSVEQTVGEGEVTVSAPPPWFTLIFRFVIPITIGLIALVILVLWLGKRRARARVVVVDEHARASSQEAAGLRGLLRRSADKILGMAAMVGKFGLGRRFYAAMTIRHIYGNLQKLAAARGQPRHPAWTPNDYLPHLERLFPGQEDALRRITAAYNAFEYGHVPTDPAELDRLRADWEAIRRTPEPE